MEEGWVKDVFDWVQANPNWTGILIFLFAFGESLLLVGIILPGAAFLLALGAMIGLGILDLYTAWIWASIGAFLGDGISFWIGHKYKRSLLKMWPMYKFPDLIAKGEAFFEKYGGVSVFMGRFVGPVRPVIPAIGGIMGMNVRLYIAISLLASILWSPFYLLPGVLFGSAIDKIAAVAGKLAVMVLVLVVLMWLVYWIISMVYLLVVPSAYRWLSALLAWTQKHPVLGKMTSGLVDPRQPERGSLAMLAFLVLLFLGLAIWLMADHAGTMAWNQQSDLFFYSFHNPWTELPVKWLMYLGHDFTLVVVTFFVAVWLLFRRLNLVLWHWLLVSFSGYVFSVLIVRLVAGSWLWFGGAHVFWFASLSAFWAVTVAGAYPIKWRSWPYILAGLLVALHSFAVLYFFKQDLGVVLLSLVSGGFWALVVGIAFRTRQRRQFLGMPVKLIFLSGLLLVSFISWLLFPQHTEVIKPQWVAEQTRDTTTGWANDGEQVLDIHVFSDLASIENTLETSGWRSLKVQSWGSLYQAMVAESESPESMPVFASLHRGELESVMMSQTHGEQLLVLHLWQVDTEQWQGYLSIHRPRTVLLWFHFWGFEAQVNDKRILTAVFKPPQFIIEHQSTGVFRIIQHGK